MHASAPTADPVAPAAIPSGSGASPKRIVRVLLVDDHPAVRAGVASLLEEERQIVLAAAVESATEALAAAAEHTPEVAVVDYELHGENGLSLARRLLALPDPPRILIYTGYADTPMAVAAIVAGADGLLSKASFGDELCHAIRMLARGHGHFPAIPRAHAAGVLRELEATDQAIAGMLIHGLDAPTIAGTLGISQSQLASRRIAILEALTAPAAGARRLPRPRRGPLDHDGLLRGPAGAADSARTSSTRTR
jgi:DNA-binding NarL/FixJ family response regulator